MGIKVSTITLKELEMTQLENGEFEGRYVNPKKYPAFLTHRSLAKGRNEGITKSSLISELIKMNSLRGEDGEIDTENLSSEQAEHIDTDKYLPVIYLGIIGANKSLDLSYEDFLDQYPGDLEQIMQDYIALIIPYLQQDSNQFKAGLVNSTKKK
ncbi:hypothetical protein [Rossellomorea sp. DUT-2]|uniref:hypothetical protein n=1 Tax=Rossellomorea sp. DUT-2 TaxID=3412021 RepID=UPI003D17F861